MQSLTKKTEEPRTVTLKPRHRWDAADLIARFGTPVRIGFPTNVVDGKQRCGVLSIITEQYILQYRGVLTQADGNELRRLLDLSAADGKPDLNRAYASLYRIKPYFA